MNGRIELVEGNRGSGKTEFLTELGYFHMRAGGYWFPNIEVNVEAIRLRMEEEGYIFEPSRLIPLPANCDNWHTKIARGTPNNLVMITIDEAQFKYDAFEGKVAKDDRGIFALARKLDILLIFATQRASKLSKVLRDDFDFMWKCKNLKQWKILGIFPFPFNIRFRIGSHMINGVPEVVTRYPVFGRQWVWKLYNSDALLGDMAQRLGGLQILEAKELTRIKTKTEPIDWAPTLAALCASLSIFLLAR